MTIQIHDSYVAVPGGELFTRRWTSGHSVLPPVVLLHDSLGCVGRWRDFPDMLARHSARDVIAYDRLGFGESTHRTDRPSVAFIQEEAHIFFPLLLDGLEIRRCSLFGHSVGGAMALAVASMESGVCEAVITESAQAFVEPRTLSGIRAAQKRFEDPVQFAKIVKWHGGRARWVLDAWVGTWLRPEFLSWSLDDYLGRVTCPVLAIHGSDDEFGSEDFPRRITTEVRGPSEMQIIDHCGHVPHRDRQDEVLRLVTSFLGRYASRDLSDPCG